MAICRKGRNHGLVPAIAELELSHLIGNQNGLSVHAKYSYHNQKKILNMVISVVIWKVDIFSSLCT